MPESSLKEAFMKMTTLRVALCVLLITGCAKTGRLGDLEAKADDLAGRCKFLEDRLLTVEKKQIQEQQALQDMHQRLRDIEAKLQYRESGNR
jgi:outer membrane murein-binding lipoprotein Lpp